MSREEIVFASNEAILRVVLLQSIWHNSKLTWDDEIDTQAILDDLREAANRHGIMVNQTGPAEPPVQPSDEGSVGQTSGI